MQKTVFFSLFTAISFSMSAQCTDIEGFKRDFCIESKNLQGAAAQYQMGLDFFYIKTPHIPTFTKLPAKTQGQDMNVYLYQLASLNDKTLNASDMLFVVEAANAFQNFEKEVAAKIMAEYAKTVTANKRTAENLATLATSNKTASGLGYEIIKKGTGIHAKAGQKVKVHYRGYLADGTIFDGSFERGQPFEFPLGQGRVIKGWDEGIAMLNVGDHAVLRIPANLGYGAQAMGKIPSNSELIFEVILMGAE